MEFGTQVCGDLAQGAAREWLVADGCGGYAMGTVCGLRTRRYHGLLVVAAPTPARRMVGLVSLDPVLTLPSGARVRLATHEWASGAVEPRGHELLASFDQTDGVPRWRWRVGGIVIERELAMAYGRPSLAVVHRLVAGAPVRLTVDAICTWRDAHGERYADNPPAIEETARGITVDGGFRIAGPEFAPSGACWHGVLHREEAARGLHPTEDLWHAASFSADLDRPGAALEIVAWAGDLSTLPPPATETIAGARRRARAIVAAAEPADGTEAALALAADAFIVTGPDVVAGYPWFGAWSRDTMISYEGLFLTTGRAAEGRVLLANYAATLDQGMLANTADTGRTEYNTADATLWFLHAVDRHVAATGDTDLAAELAPALAGIVEHHVAGTRYGIRADPADGLLTQGAEGYALTWMDAVIDGVAVTPRPGKAVEINALWVNGLAGLAAAHPGNARLNGLHSTARAGFRRRFPAPTGLLYDTVDPADPALRANQLLAYSLPYAPMEPDPALLRRIAAALTTPLGPRSLAPGEPGYRGAHRGSPRDRDEAYHQGTVWPWLTGPLVDAYTKAGLPAGDLLGGLAAHLGEWGLGSISETAEADPPHRATGCPFQAWSVAEIGRAARVARGAGPGSDKRRQRSG
jgi:predicted glycogen debranching enzyme